MAEAGGLWRCHLGDEAEINDYMWGTSMFYMATFLLLFLDMPSSPIAH